ncbi:MAG: hypothetical protein OQJ81_01525, partial [Melioribacteraceae bacterium]|nr:hypothetical protein [Melioribacteraceae bacterium]
MIFIIGVIGNSLIRNTIENWAETSETIVQETKNKVTELIKLKQENLLEHEKQIISSLKSIKRNDFTGFISQLQHFNQNNLRLSIYQNDSLVYWNENYLDQNSFEETLKYEFGEIFFIQSDIHSYFALRDTVAVNNIIYTLFISDIAEKQYQLNDDYFSEISLKDEISKQIETVFQLEYSPKANKTKDGRKYSFDIFNNKDKVIGVATFLKPSREKAVDHIENKIYILQGFLALLGYLILGFLLFKFEKINKNKLLKFITITAYLFVFRYLLILLKFPSSLFTSDLFSDKYYFSNFGSGLAYSPVELLITLILVFGFIYYSFKYSIEYYKAQKDKRVKNNLILILSILIGIGLYILALRGIGASIRGFVFDTSLRYFQNTSLAFSFPHLVMHINTLIIGLISIIGSASIVVLIFSKLQNYYSSLNYKSVLVLIVILFSADLIYTYQQNNPQLTILLKLLQMLLVFIIVYLILIYDVKR